MQISAFATVMAFVVAVIAFIVVYALVVRLNMPHG